MRFASSVKFVVTLVAGFCTAVSAQAMPSSQETSTPDASTAALAQIPLSGIKEVTYMPADEAWTNMWTDFRPTEIQADFERASRIDVNTVRLILDPTTMGYPTVSHTAAAELAEVMDLAQQAGLHVQLTLFDWWDDYEDVSGSEAWLQSVLSAYRSDPQIAFIELKNEINTAQPVAMLWAGRVLATLRSVAGSIPITISSASENEMQGLNEIKTQLGSLVDFLDFHIYGNQGEAYEILHQAQALAAPMPLFIGETGFTTYTPNPVMVSPATMESEQASYLATVEADTRSLGLPPAAVWQLNDLVQAGVPTPEAYDPTQLHFGLFHSDGTAKPAAAVVKSLFGTGALPILLGPNLTPAEEGVPLGWNSSGPGTGTFSWSATAGPDNSPAVEITASHTQASWMQMAKLGAVQSSERLSATVKISATGEVGWNALAISWFGPQSQYLGNSFATPTSPLTDNWQTLSVTSVAPVDASWATLYLESAYNLGTVRFSNVTLNRT